MKEIMKEMHNAEMYVVGKTTPQEVFVASTGRKFVIDEYLQIIDEINGDPIGEVVDAFSYSKVSERTFPPESGIYDSLEQYNLHKSFGSVYFARVRMLDELKYPVAPYASVTVPDFSDIEELLVPSSLENGLVLGLIRGTESFQPSLPESLRYLVLMYQEKLGVVPQKGVPFVFPPLRRKYERK